MISTLFSPVNHGKIILTSLFVQKQITCNLVGFDLLVIDDYLLVVTFVNSIFIRIKNLAVYFMTENCSFFVMRLPCPVNALYG